MKRDQLISNLRNIFKHNDKKHKDKLYSHLVDMEWWCDNATINDIEREKLLYEAFSRYYDMIWNGEVRETETEGKEHELRYRLINICKMQLDVEIAKVKRRSYEKDYEYKNSHTIWFLKTI